jgi:hypothetical protein
LNISLNSIIEKNIDYVPAIPISVNHKKLNEWFAFLFVFTYLIFQPFVKYNENVYGGFRFNITLINVLILLLIIANSLFLIRSFSYRRIPLVVIIFIQIILIQLFSYYWIRDYSFHSTLIYVKTLSKSLIASSLWLIAGAYLYDIINGANYRRVLRVAWTLLTFFFIYNSVLNALRFSIDLGDNLIYLMLADNYAILGIFAVHATRSKVMRHFVFILSIVTLFALLSRTSLYFFVAIYIMYLYRENKKLLLTMLTLSFILALNASSDVKEGRMLKMVFGGPDKSASMRYGMLIDGLNSIKENWFTGQFMGDINEYAGTEGYYIHNYLAIWRQYGLIPFVVIILTIIVNQFKLGTDWLKNAPLKEAEMLLFYFSMFVIFEIVFARTFDHPYIWMSFVPAMQYFRNRVNPEPER